MLNGGDGIENGKKTTTIGLISKTKQQQICTCSSLGFLCCCCCTTTTRNFLVTRFVEDMSYFLTKKKVMLLVFLFAFFLTAAHLNLTGC